MTNEEVKKNIWRNSLSSYLCQALKMGMGLLMFRMLYQTLSREEFGFWALLWSVFGFGTLLDFGFGFTAQKRVAELSAIGEWDHLSRILSTIFFVYLVIGLVMFAVVWAGSAQMISLFHIDPANQHRFRMLLILFFVGMGVTFPLGVFPEMLVGCQRIALVNTLFFLGVCGNFIGLCAAMYFHWGLMTLLAMGLLAAILPSIASAYYALRLLPKVRIRLRLFSMGMVRETTQFSLYAYVITVSNLLLAKTDQLVISTALAVAAVAIYQAGAKVGDMFINFTQMLPDAFSPAAAHLHAKGDKDFLRELLVNGTRLSVIIGTPLYMICAFYMQGLVRLLTGAPPSRETFWIGQVLLFWGYSSLITQSVSKRIFIMCGHEKKLMLITVAETILNLGLSIGLILHFKNVLCVALGSLISSMLVGWGYLWPWMIRESRLSGWQLAATIIFPIWLACLPLLGFLLFARFCPWFDFRGSTPIFIAESMLAFAVGGLCLWRGALKDGEREHLVAKFDKILGRVPA
ncbi:MAG TPA: oligosaccharide flippase family protein [Candidatus Saccharimonadales bacterium]|nr:oligosaccharide flippase family protein [Candidatus Saccharimonadales bacterium]